MHIFTIHIELYIYTVYVLSMYDVKKKTLIHVTTYTQWIGTHHISPYLTMKSHTQQQR